MSQDNDLLSPSLSPSRGGRRSIYSATVGYVAGFFGGPVSAAVVAMVNSYRLQRVRADWPLAVLAVVLAGLLAGPDSWGISNRIADAMGDNAARFVWRLGGLLIFAAFYWAHRAYYRSMSVMGIEPPSGWLLGIGAIVAGILATVGLSQLGAQ